LKKHILAFLLVIFFISPVYSQSNIITDVFTTISADYINQNTNKDIMLKGLKCLNKIDSLIKLKPTDNKLYFYYGNKMIKSFNVPAESDNIQIWIDFTQNIIQKAIKISPKIEIIDFEIPDRFAQEVFDGLDGYSHYYSSYSDDADTPRIIRRNFASRILDNNILFIKILAFRKDVSQKVQKTIEECSQCKALILDLRGNHGGLFDEAIKITDMLLDEGIITYTMSKDGINPKYYTSTAGDIFNNNPVVVLVDGFSASASEILSAALSEQNRAVLIGTNTYGKGTVQDVFKSSSGSAMTLTTSYFYTPGGNIIDKKGLTPSLCTGGLKSGHIITDGKCDKEDRFTNEADIEIAIKFIKDEL